MIQQGDLPGALSAVGRYSSASASLGDQAVKQCLRTGGGIAGSATKSPAPLREADECLHQAYRA
ncbi:hypothetical protein DEX24_16760 [Kurthia sibirica]|uniref:Uncharacterized protein n=1 Tax=Kurthia sibirica TaxID=202750 RepID=A0A2U3ADS6_9BACL|nr:hypothetical protein DEX24_16760 [Kurthia sibirica]